MLRPVEDTTPTVREILAMPEVRRGHPEVVAGRAGLDRAVSWVHVLELSDVAGLLHGGELVLLTGVALPDSNDGLRGWVDELAAAGVCGAVVQLGERWSKLPPALVRAADAAGLVLVVLHTVVPFVDITRSALTSILGSTHAELQHAARVHELFHRMALEGRSDAEVLSAAGWLCGTSVVLENRNHHVLAFQTIAGEDSEAVLRDWERRSRRDGAGEGWIHADVRARGQVWGRLVALIGPGVEPTRRQLLAVERGAENIALRRVIEGDGALFELEARAELLGSLTRGIYRYEAEGRMRAEAAGFPLAGRTVLGVAIEALNAPVEEVRLALARAAEAARLDLLMGLDGAGLVSLPAGREPDAVLGALAERLGRELGPVVIGVGEPIATLRAIHGSLLDARGAAHAEAAHGGARPVVRLSDVGARGLLAQLHGDPRLQSFVERELGPLLAGARAGELAALRAYFAAGQNKSAAAHRERVSRPAFYARLRRAADRLDGDLDDAETCLSLQLALLAHEIAAGAVRTGATGRRGPADRPGGPDPVAEGGTAQPAPATGGRP
jgi:purine catabolism regulator